MLVQNKNQILGRDRPPPDGQPRGPGKRTRREDHALLIVRDEFRTGYSSIGLLASRARLRFTGYRQNNSGRGREKGIIIESQLRLFLRVSPKGFTP